MSDQFRESINSNESKPQIAPKPVELPPINVDFSRPPEPVLSAPAESQTVKLIENVEIHPETEIRRSAELVIDHKLKQRENAIQNFKNRIQYPSSISKNIILDNIRTPAIITATAGLVGMGITGIATLPSIPSDNPIMLGIIIKGFLGSAVLTLASISVERVSDMIVQKMVKKEIRNRISFSNLVTVSKVYDSDSDTKFSGELHFVGRNREDWKGIDSKTKKIKDILSGLKNLAQACEENDPRLAEINTFTSSSAILHPNYFSEFGFNLAGSSEIRGGSKIGNRLTKFWDSLIKYKEESYHGELSDKNEIIYTGTITRQSLVDNKALISEKLAQLSKRI